jgi:hypothetical protein
VDAPRIQEAIVQHAPELPVLELRTREETARLLACLGGTTSASLLEFM